MNLNEYLDRSLSFTRWADTKILQAVTQPGVPDKALRLAAHYFITYTVWASRMAGDPLPLPIWPDPAGFDFANVLAEGHARLEAALKAHASDMDAALAYKSSQGHPFTNTVADIVQHVILHGQYHRGQINQLLREAGLEPVSIDFISFARE